MSSPENELKPLAYQLSNQFGSFALVVRRSDENNCDYVMSTWRGPWSDVMGLVSIFKVRAQAVEKRRFEAEMNSSDDVPADEL